METCWIKAILLLNAIILSQAMETKIVRKTNLEHHLRDTFSNPRGQGEEGKVTARESIIKFMTSLTQDTTRVHLVEQEFTGTNMDTNTVHTGVNFILQVEGSNWATRRDEIIVMASSYDTAPTSPGVNALGSGMSALMESARIARQSLDHCILDHSIIFVALDSMSSDSSASMAFFEDFLIPDVFGKYKIPADQFQGVLLMESLLNYNDTPSSQNAPEDYFNTFFRQQWNYLKSNQMRGTFVFTAGRGNEVYLNERFEEHFKQVKSQANDVDHMKISVNLLNGRLSDSILGDSLKDIVEQFVSGEIIHLWDFPRGYFEEGIKTLYISDTGKLRGVMQNCWNKPCDDGSLITNRNLEFLSIVTEASVKLLLELTLMEPAECCVLKDQCMLSDGSDPPPKSTVGEKKTSNGDLARGNLSTIVTLLLSVLLLH